ETFEKVAANVRQVGKTCIQLIPVPNDTTINPLSLRHPTILDHFIKLCRAYADIPSGLLSIKAARRVCERVKLSHPSPPFPQCGAVMRPNIFVAVVNRHFTTLTYCQLLSGHGRVLALRIMTRAASSSPDMPCSAIATWHGSILYFSQKAFSFIECCSRCISGERGTVQRSSGFSALPVSRLPKCGAA